MLLYEFIIFPHVFPIVLCRSIIVSPLIKYSAVMIDLESKLCTLFMLSTRSKQKCLHAEALCK